MVKGGHQKLSLENVTKGPSDYSGFKSGCAVPYYLSKPFADFPGLFGGT